MKMRPASIASWCLTASLALSALTYSIVQHVKREQAIMCLAESIYYEGRNQLTGHQRLLAALKLARVFDADPQWPKTVCGVIAQERAFSWTLDYKLATDVREQRSWAKSVELAREVYEEFGTTQLMPHGWACARYYKRTDDRGVSEAGRRFFAKLVPVGTFGSHTAYRDPKRCVTPLRST
jgi:spore germination cell wall hydrolase CwlJ-like protein